MLTIKNDFNVFNNVLKFSWVQSFTALHFFKRFMKVYSNKNFKEKSSMKD